MSNLNFHVRFEKLAVTSSDGMTASDRKLLRFLSVLYDKFLISRRPTFRVLNFTCEPDRSGAQIMGDENESVRPIETLPETFLFVFYYLK